MPPKPNADTYCQACKKKFSNAATFNNHLKSAKHVANEKKLKTVTKTKEATNETTKEDINKTKEEIIKQVISPIQKIENLKNSTDLWDNVLALLSCIEIGDIVRGQPIYKKLCTENYRDVQLICNLFQSHYELGSQNELQDEFRYLELLSRHYKELEEPVLIYTKESIELMRH
ncbi:unnamed protein product [Rhizopus stolonifer]